MAYNISKLQTLKANKNAPNLLKKYFKHFDNIIKLQIEQIEQIEQIAEAGNEDQGVPGDAAHDSG